jgi:hypothetical protein
MTGDWPENDLDHKDTIRTSNVWTNLRPATRGQNRCNTKAGKNNTLGIKGVTLRGTR